MNAQKILFATDFSEASDAAFEQAVSLAHDCHATLLIVHVHQPLLYYGEGAMYPLPDSETEELRQLREMRVADPKVHCEHYQLRGDPAREIVRFADQEHADLIVVGSHGRRGLKRMLMGSVAEDVVRHAHCPVYTVKSMAPASMN